MKKSEKRIKKQLFTIVSLCVSVKNQVPSDKKSTAFSNENKYSRDLNLGLVQISNGRKEVGLQLVRILDGIWNLETQPFEI